MTVGPFDTRHPDVIEQEKQERRKEQVRECRKYGHAATDIGITENGKIVAECADCPCNELVAEKIDEKLLKETGELHISEWREW